MRMLWRLAVLSMFTALAQAHAQTAERVVDVPTRPGVTQRMLVLSPAAPKAAVLLLAGGHGGLQIRASGSITWGAGNFLVRSRQLFADQGLMVAVVDAPSDRQSPPYLAGVRQSNDHVADIKAAIAWLRAATGLPVWIVGTSRGTQSAAHVAIELPGPEGPDGIVLSATILADKMSRPVPSMALGKINVPVLVVHHEKDGCALCSFSDIPLLMSKLKGNPRRELLSFTTGRSEGDPCEAFSYHGFNGIEPDVVQQVANWILVK
jgi:pimeloyl-ACP methyl ester carboxylesterase